MWHSPNIFSHLPEKSSLEVACSKMQMKYFCFQGWMLHSSSCLEHPTLSADSAHHNEIPLANRSASQDLIRSCFCHCGVSATSNADLEWHAELKGFGTRITNEPALKTCPFRHDSTSNIKGPVTCLPRSPKAVLTFHLIDLLGMESLCGGIGKIDVVPRHYCRLVNGLRPPGQIIRNISVL